jgi:hypothetical protein
VTTTNATPVTVDNSCNSVALSFLKTLLDGTEAIESIQKEK